MDDSFSRHKNGTPLLQSATSRARIFRRLTVTGTGRWHAPLGRRSDARVLAVCGPASAGKSTVAANLAVALAGLRSRVVLIDLDLRRPTQHRLFGVTSRVAGLNALLADQVDTIEQALVPTTVRNLFLVTADGVRLPPHPGPEQQWHLLEQIWELDADVIVVDVANTESDPVIDPFDLGALRVVVTAPEAPVIAGAYAFLRRQVLREIERAGGGAETAALRAAMDASPAPQMRQLLATLAAQPRVQAAVTWALAAFTGCLVGNHARNAEEADLLHALSRLVADYLGVVLPVLGIVGTSESLASSESAGRPLLLGAGIDRNVRLFHSMAEQLLREPTENDAAPTDDTDAGPPDELRAGPFTIEARRAPNEPPSVAPTTVPPLPVALGVYMRRHPRQPVDWHARYLSREGRATDVRVLEISEGGASIDAIFGFDLGAGGHLTFTQIDGQPTLDVTVMDAHRPLGRAGLRFDSAPDLAARLATIARASSADSASHPSCL